MKNQYRNRTSPDPISKREPASKLYYDKKYNYPSIKKHRSC